MNSASEHLAAVLTGLASASIGLLCLVGRHSASYARLFSTSDAKSLMRVSSLGALPCICNPTDAAGVHQDRRRTCRACGNQVMESEPALLYEAVTSKQIRELTGYISRLARQARHTSLGEGSEPGLLAHPSSSADL